MKQQKHYFFWQHDWKLQASKVWQDVSWGEPGTWSTTLLYSCPCGKYKVKRISGAWIWTGKELVSR